MRGNAFTFLILYAWPAIVLAVFAARRGKASVARTTAWMMLLAVMFLPSLTQLSIGALDKHRVACLSVAVALLLFHPEVLSRRTPGQWFPTAVFAALVLGTVATVQTNGDTLSFGPLTLPGLTWRDGAWMLWSVFFDFYLPFTLGRRVFRTEQDLLDLLDVLSRCALIYAPLCLIELRLSPQLHNWVYGYIPTDFIQATRGSGYRPVVFMNHGLSVAMFLFTGFCAGLGLRHTPAEVRPAPGWRAAVAGVLLLLGRSMGSLIFSLMAGVLQLLASRRMLARAVVAGACLALLYPTLRAEGLFPTRAIGEWVGRISQQRRDSLEFRFVNEDMLLERARERLAFGWGSWGRNRVYVSWGEWGDDDAGYADASVTDGQWILALGAKGVVGLLGMFALYAAPLFVFARRWRGAGPPLQGALGALALMVLALLVDLIPNSASDFLGLVYAGALFTLAQQLPRERARRRRAEAAAAARMPRAEVLVTPPPAG